MGSSPSDWITLGIILDHPGHVSTDLLPVTALDVQKLLVSAPQHKFHGPRGTSPTSMQLFHGKILRKSSEDQSINQSINQSIYLSIYIYMYRIGKLMECSIAIFESHGWDLEAMKMAATSPQVVHVPHLIILAPNGGNINFSRGFL